MTLVVPPLKSQGIKTRLVPWIAAVASLSGASGRWIEPFFGTGVVGFNVWPGRQHIVGDSNPHIVAFYQALAEGRLTPGGLRRALLDEGRLLSEAADNGYEHYRRVRDRFNVQHRPEDFLFLSRAGFNGLMRFNAQGRWNVPFCKKPERFRAPYVTKICNQAAAVAQILQQGRWSIECRDFRETIALAQVGDLIYCDPPYLGRSTDYYNTWDAAQQEALLGALADTPAHFILSTWHHTPFRDNPLFAQLPAEFRFLTRRHFYHAGASEEHRHEVVEALVLNFEVDDETLGALERSREQVPVEAQPLLPFAV